jgi:hypothetical protein
MIGTTGNSCNGGCFMFEDMVEEVKSSPAGCNRRLWRVAVRVV